MSKNDAIPLECGTSTMCEHHAPVQTVSRAWHRETEAHVVPPAPRTALNPTGVGSGVDGPSSIHAKSHTGHWFKKAKTLGPPALVLTPEEDSTFQCSAICPAASLPALNPTGNLFPFNGFTVKWKAPGHKSSLGLEGVRIIVAIKRRALSLNIPMHSLFFSPFFQQL